MNEAVRDKLIAFFEGSTTKTYAKGAILTLANEDPKHICLLLEGIVEQYDITPEGNKITVNMFKPGAFFPMSWAINRTPNSYFYAALTEIKVKQANPDKVVAFLRDNPDVLFDLLSRVYKGTDALLRRLVLAANGIASSRLIFELLIEAYRFGTDLSETAKLVKVRQSNLAARTGLARETVSRELHKLENDGLLKRTKHGMVLQVELLEKKLDLII